MSIHKLTLYIFTLLSMFLMFSAEVYAQNKVIHCFVMDQEHHPIDYFTAALMSAKDSSIITGGAFFDGDCALKYENQSACLLQISSVSYQSVILPVDLSAKILPDTIVLNNNNLKEVVVSSKRPVYSVKKGTLLLNVQSTALKDLGTSMDVLRRAPGLQIDQDNNISLFGKGTPIVFIDGREVQSNDELNMLQSSNISRIEVDRNPSAQYSADSKSVIRIYTKAAHKDQISIKLYDQIKKGRKWGNRSGVSVSQQKGKFINNLSYQYQLSQIEYSNDGYTYNYQTDYTLKNITSTYNEKKKDKHSLIVGSQFDMDSVNRFSLQYQFYGNTGDLSRTTDQYISYSDYEIEKMQEQNKDSKYNYHNIGLNYTHKFDSINSLLLKTDFSSISDKDHSYIDEYNITTDNLEQTKLVNKDIYDVLTFDASYKTSIKDVKINSGLKYSFIHDKGVAQSFDLLSDEINYDEEQLVNDNIAAAYISANHDVSSFSFNYGVRGELSNTYIEYEGEVIKDSAYLSLFPTLSINWSGDNKKSISFSYSRNIERPSFTDLNPTVSYYDSLSYYQGNSDLKPAISNNLALRLGLPHNLSFSTEYCYETNSIVAISQPDEDDEDVTKVSPINLDHASTLNFMTAYNYSGKILSIDANAGMVFPFIDIPYMDDIYEISDKYWYFSINSDLSLGKYLSLWAELNVNSDNSDYITMYSNTTNVNAGMVASLLDKRLKIVLSVIGITDTGDWSWYEKYGSLYCGGSNDFDNRYVSLSVKFNINNYKNLIKHKTSNSKEVNRL